jgi:CubicO group peptidase (beta-lactamase class C family)
MQGFPPSPDARVTLANWQDPPFNRWAFSHMREIVPTQLIRRGYEMSPQPAEEYRDIGDVQVHRVDGSDVSVNTVFEETYTDALIILHDGKVVSESYSGETNFDTPHLMMSVTKSIVGAVAANLIESGYLHYDEPLTKYVPEFEGSGYAEATVRNLLDMRSGIKFSEEYTNPDAEVRVMEEAFGWRPASEREVPNSIYDYLRTLDQKDDHGGAFDYRSCETLALGWICERAAGEKMASLISRLIWVPMRADWNAEMTCDSLGTAIHDGGMCATVRDLSRFGQMLLSGGVSLGGEQVVPADWLRTTWTVDPDIRDAFDRSDAGPYMPGGWYRNHFWFLPRAHGDVLLALGIYGQMLYVNPGTKTVAAKFSTWPDAQSSQMMHDTIRAFDAIGARLAGLEPERSRHDGPPGIAAGLSR